MTSAKKNIWPHALEYSIKSGFSDSELEYICSNQIFDYDRKLGFKFPRWMYWTSEHYSFGRCYREWLGLPWWAPLPFYSDHGVHLAGEFGSHEKDAKSNLHFVFNADRVAVNLNTPKTIIQVPHPWVVFKHVHRLDRSKSSCGTLIFFTKSIVGVEVERYDYDRYFKSLEDLPDKYKPFSICMHMHDIRKGYHKNIRRYGIPVISAGESSSPVFVERFYDIIRNFKYATSNSGGSELFYCVDFGLEYFLYGRKPTKVNFSNPSLAKGEIKPLDSIDEWKSSKKNNLFRDFPPRNSPEKLNFVNDNLGLNVDAYQVRKRVKRLLLIEYVKNLPTVFRFIILNIASNHVPCVILVAVKKMLHSIRRSQ